MKKIIHIINDLDTGGAEMMLFKLLSQSNHEDFNHTVISLIDKGSLGTPIEKFGVKVHTLGMIRGSFPGPLSILRLFHLVRKLRPDVVQGWMYHGNLAALLSRMGAINKPKLIWNIRHPLYDLRKEKKQTSFLIRICAKFSLKPQKTIYNSGKSMKQHINSGYSSSNCLVLPNGFDCNQFKPSHRLQTEFRNSLGLDGESIIIGLVGRYHAIKDHRNFINAAGMMIKEHKNVHFVLVGLGLDNHNGQIVHQIKEQGLDGHVHLLGERRDINKITAGFDIATSSSWGEAFPNVIGEAMACEVPCVVTDVGDSALIVGDTGIVVPPKDPVSLRKGWISLIEMGESKRKKLGKAARKRIMDYFSLPVITRQYEDMYRDICAV